MSIFSKKLNSEDLEEMKKRTELINQHKLIVEALELQNQIYIKNILPKYRVDMNKNYSIDLKNGRIEKTKEEPKK